MLLSLSGYTDTQLTKSDRASIEGAPRLQFDDQSLLGPYAAVVLDPTTILIPGWVTSPARHAQGIVRLRAGDLHIRARVIEQVSAPHLPGIRSTTVLSVLAVERR